MNHEGGTAQRWTFGGLELRKFGDSSLKWLYSKQPKLGLTQEFVVDCAHALWVVHSTKTSNFNVVKWFLSYSFIYFMYRMLNEHF